MDRAWIDAEYVVVTPTLRIGDPHPQRPRWRYAGPDAHGRAVWYRPPRFNRWQLAGAGVVGVVGWYAVLIGAAVLLGHH